MAQIIKHRRGSIDSLVSATAKKGELVMATGSVGNMNGPWIFVGETEGSAGAFRTLSKIYQGSVAPDLTGGSYGSTLNGTPFYSSTDQTLYLLSNVGNITMDLTGNIEGNVISGVTINNLTGNTGVFDTFVSASALNVTGDTTFNGDVTITGLTDNRLVLVGTGGILEDSPNLTFDGSTFNIGQGQFEVDNNTGNIRTSGSITMKGNITIGDNQGGDVIDLNAEISSSLVPSGSNLFDLGSPTNAWKDLYVSGTAFIENINIGQVSTTNLELPGDLTVTGTTILSGSVYLDDLTEKRLVVVGTDGILTDYSGLTFDNGNLNLSGALEVTDIQGTGSLYLKPDKNDSRLFQIYNTAPSDIHFKGNATYNFFGDDTNFLKIDDSLSKISIESVGGVDIITSGSLNIKTEDGNDLFVSSSSDLTFEADTDVTITAGDDLRLYSNDTFSLRNYSDEESITLITNYNGVSKTLNFDVNGNLTIPGGFTGSYADINGTTTISVANDEMGINNLLVEQRGIELNTWDVTSNVTHSVFLDNTGSLTLDNVNFRLSGSLNVNGNSAFDNDLTVHGNMYVSGNFQVLGTGSIITLSGSQVDIGTNKILLNTYSPFERFAGIDVYDSGSNVGVTGSLLWDSQNNVWIYANPSGSSYASARFIAGPKNTGSLGEETGLTVGHFPIAVDDDHIADSLLTYLGTTLAFNTNKFTVDSGTGDTSISGNFTLSYSGGTDNGNKTSTIMFRNSSNVVGFVSTTETTDVLDGILGYKNSDGSLKFSTVIDGGSY